MYCIFISMQAGYFERLDEKIFVKKGLNIIGREHYCHIVIPHEALSSKHSLVFVEDSEKHFVCDLKSTNGTKVNDELIANDAFHPLNDGDRVSFGGYEVLYFKLADGIDGVLNRSADDIQTSTQAEENAGELHSTKDPLDDSFEFPSDCDVDGILDGNTNGFQVPNTPPNKSKKKTNQSTPDSVVINETLESRTSISFIDDKHDDNVEEDSSMKNNSDASFKLLLEETYNFEASNVSSTGEVDRSLCADNSETSKKNPAIAISSCKSSDDIADVKPSSDKQKSEEISSSGRNELETNKNHLSFQKDGEKDHSSATVEGETNHNNGEEELNLNNDDDDDDSHLFDDSSLLQNDESGLACTQILPKKLPLNVCNRKLMSHKNQVKETRNEPIERIEDSDESTQSFTEDFGMNNCSNSEKNSCFETQAISNDSNSVYAGAPRMSSVDFDAETLQVVTGNTNNCVTSGMHADDASVSAETDKDEKTLEEVKQLKVKDSVLDSNITCYKPPIDAGSKSGSNENVGIVSEPDNRNVHAGAPETSNTDDKTAETADKTFPPESSDEEGVETLLITAEDSGKVDKACNSLEIEKDNQQLEVKNTAEDSNLQAQIYKRETPVEFCSRVPLKNKIIPKSAQIISNKNEDFENLCTQDCEPDNADVYAGVPQEADSSETLPPETSDISEAETLLVTEENFETSSREVDNISSVIKKDDLEVKGAVLEVDDDCSIQTQVYKSKMPAQVCSRLPLEKKIIPHCTQFESNNKENLENLCTQICEPDNVVYAGIPRQSHFGIADETLVFEENENISEAKKYERDEKVLPSPKEVDNPVTRNESSHHNASEKEEEDDDDDDDDDASLLTTDQCSLPPTQIFPRKFPEKLCTRQPIKKYTKNSGNSDSSSVIINAQENTINHAVVSLESSDDTDDETLLIAGENAPESASYQVQKNSKTPCISSEIEKDAQKSEVKNTDLEDEDSSLQTQIYKRETPVQVCSRLPLKNKTLPRLALFEKNNKEDLEDLGTQICEPDNNDIYAGAPKKSDAKTANETLMEAETLLVTNENSQINESASDQLQKNSNTLKVVLEVKDTDMEGDDSSIQTQIYQSKMPVQVCSRVPLKNKTVPQWTLFESNNKEELEDLCTQNCEPDNGVYAGIPQQCHVGIADETLVIEENENVSESRKFGRDEKVLPSPKEVDNPVTRNESSHHNASEKEEENDDGSLLQTDQCSLPATQLLPTKYPVKLCTRQPIKKLTENVINGDINCVPINTVKYTRNNISATPLESSNVMQAETLLVTEVSTDHSQANRSYSDEDLLPLARIAKADDVENAKLMETENGLLEGKSSAIKTPCSTRTIQNSKHEELDGSSTDEDLFPEDMVLDTSLLPTATAKDSTEQAIETMSQIQEFVSKKSPLKSSVNRENEVEDLKNDLLTQPIFLKPASPKKQKRGSSHMIRKANDPVRNIIPDSSEQTIETISQIQEYVSKKSDKSPKKSENEVDDLKNDLLTQPIFLKPTSTEQKRGGSHTSKKANDSGPDVNPVSHEREIETMSQIQEFVSKESPDKSENREKEVEELKNDLLTQPIFIKATSSTELKRSSSHTSKKANDSGPNVNPVSHGQSVETISQIQELVPKNSSNKSLKKSENEVEDLKNDLLTQPIFLKPSSSSKHIRGRSHTNKKANDSGPNAISVLPEHTVETMSQIQEFVSTDETCAESLPKITENEVDDLKCDLMTQTIPLSSCASIKFSVGKPNDVYTDEIPGSPDQKCETMSQIQEFLSKNKTRKSSRKLGANEVENLKNDLLTQATTSNPCSASKSAIENPDEVFTDEIPASPERKNETMSQIQEFVSKNKTRSKASQKTRKPEVVEDMKNDLKVDSKDDSTQHQIRCLSPFTENSVESEVETNEPKSKRRCVPSWKVKENKEILSKTRSRRNFKSLPSTSSAGTGQKVKKAKQSAANVKQSFVEERISSDENEDSPDIVIPCKNDISLKNSNSKSTLQLKKDFSKSGRPSKRKAEDSVVNMKGSEICSVSSSSKYPKLEIEVTSNNEMDMDIADMIKMRKRSASIRPSSALSGTSNSEKFKHQNVIFTFVKNVDLQNKVEKLGGTIGTSPTECTVLVTEEVKRSVKFLCVLGMGKPIVSPKWIQDSFKARAFLDPMNYVLKDTKKEKQFSFQLENSLKKARESSLLKGFNFFVTPSVRPPPSEMKDIIESGGGRVLHKIPVKWPSKSIVISCQDDEFIYKKWKTKRFPIIEAEALIISILQQNFNYDDHLL